MDTSEEKTMKVSGQLKVIGRQLGREENGKKGGKDLVKIVKTFETLYFSLLKHISE